MQYTNLTEKMKGMQLDKGGKHASPNENPKKQINKGERTIIAFFLCDGGHVLPTTADMVVNWRFKIPFIITFWNRMYFRKIGHLNWLSDLVSNFLAGDKEYVDSQKEAFRKERGNPENGMAEYRRRARESRVPERFWGQFSGRMVD